MGRGIMEDDLASEKRGEMKNEIPRQLARLFMRHTLYRILLVVLQVHTPRPYHFAVVSECSFFLSVAFVT